MRLGVVFLLLPLCVCVHVEWIAGVGATGIGVNYGARQGSESAEDFVQLLRSRGIGKIRLHDADSAMLQALSSASGESSIEVIVGVRNDEIVDVGVSLASAESWVARNVAPYFPATNIIAIAVGSEVLTTGQDDHDTIVPFLVPAMKNIYAALSDLGLEKEIKVSAPQSLEVLSSYFPPSSATFIGDGTGGVIAPLLEFLVSSESYFMLNLYPLDLQGTHVGLEADLSLAGRGMEDPQTGLRYSNMFDALIDALSVAIATLDHHRLNIVMIQTGWSRTAFSTDSRSSAYNAYVMDRSAKGLGTPLNPTARIDTYVDGDLLLSLQEDQEKIRDRAFSSRRLLLDPLDSRPVKSANRRRLGPNKSWCVAKSDASTQALQSALDWACGQGGANCQPLQVGQSCFLPNNIVAHASYAFNSYYQKQSWASGSCDFGGLATTTTTDPSTTSCLYSSNTSANGTPSTPTGTTVPGVTSRIKWDRRGFLLTTIILMFLLKRTLSDMKF